MSKRYNIKWTPDDDKLVSKTVKNFNAKITRLEKKYPEMKGALPERMSVKLLKELISTRADLNREINSLKRFTQRGAEQLVDVPDNNYNLKITKWQKQDMSMRKGIANRKRKQMLAEISDIDVTSMGEKVGYKRGDIGMGKLSELEFSPINNFTPSMNRKDLSKKHRMLIKESQSDYWHKRDILMKENYIKSLEENFRAEDIEEIKNTIESMDFKEFRKIFEAEGGNFELSYPPDEESYNAHLTALRSIWKPKRKG